MNAVSRVQHRTALFDGGGRETIVNHGRGEKAEPGMAMLLVVPGEELLREGPRVLQRAEAFPETPAGISKSGTGFPNTGYRRRHADGCGFW